MVAPAKGSVPVADLRSGDARGHTGAEDGIGLGEGRERVPGHAVGTERTGEVDVARHVERVGGHIGADADHAVGRDAGEFVAGAVAHNKGAGAVGGVEGHLGVAAVGGGGEGRDDECEVCCFHGFLFLSLTEARSAQRRIALLP